MAFFPPEVSETDGGHGRITTRSISRYTIENPEYYEFPHLCQVLRIRRDVEKIRKGRVVKKDSETVFVVTSLAPQRADALELLHIVRWHWLIENQNHWVRDVVFGEDQCRVRTKNSPENLAILRTLALNLIRMTGRSDITRFTREGRANPATIIRMVTSRYHYG